MEKLLRPEILSLLIPIIVIIGGFVYKIFKYNSENELKRLMIQRGMSAEEIERVLASKSKSRK